MTREEAIKVIKSIIDVEQEYGGKDNIDALNMAIQALSSWEKYSDRLWKEAYERGKAEALSQEPCPYSTKDGYCQYDDIAETIPTEQEPCDECRNKRTSFCGNCKEYDEFEPCTDVVSREAVLGYLKSNVDDFPDYHEAIEKVLQMPPVTVRQTQMVDKSNFDIEQYKMDLQCAYDCGFGAGKKVEQEPCDDAISQKENSL